MSNSDLPVTNNSSSDKVVAFFDDRFNSRLEFSSNDYDTVVNFFEKRNFETIASKTLAQVLLSEAKKENIKIFQLLDTFKGLNKTQLNSIILKILNESRSKVSQLGYRTITKTGQYEERNITDTITNSDEYKYYRLNSVTDIKNIVVGIQNSGNGILNRD